MNKSLQAGRLQVSVVADSVSPAGHRLTTIHARYWRAIHAELNTHRDFSKNARSSRAVPTKKLIAEVRHNPFIPVHWGKNQKGMQAYEECDEMVVVRDSDTIFTVDRQSAWVMSATRAVEMAESYEQAGYHKQIVNRLLEPYMYIDTLISATEWNNFFALRTHETAEPHFKDLADEIKRVRENSVPRYVDFDDWHMPYITDEERLAHPTSTLLKLSAARCARISYVPFDGVGDVESELRRYSSLVESQPVHASPVEHQAFPGVMVRGIWVGRESHRNYVGWVQHRSLIKGETKW